MSLMLGKLSLSDVQRLRDELEKRLAGEDGERWMEETKHFLRKEPCWSPVSEVNATAALCPDYSINLDADPFIPKDWSVEEHQKRGIFEWDPSKVSLYLSTLQQEGKSIRGDTLREELKGKPVFNAVLLDYLLKHPNLIPEEWKDKCIFFWGTIYRYSDGSLYVRCLYWHGDGWDWGCHWLDGGWCSDDPALVLAST